MENGEIINLLQQWFEARAENIADAAADKAMEKSERRTADLIRIHKEACSGAHHAENFSRCFWVLLTALIGAAVLTAVAIARSQ